MTQPPKETFMPRGKLWFAVLSVAVALCVAPSAASADTITVDVIGDAVGNGNGCTLREAITASNTNATVDSCLHDGSTDLDTIIFSVTLPILLSQEVAGQENSNVEGDLDILAGTGGLTIEGGASIVAIASTGGWAERIFDRVSGSGLVELRNLGIEDGNDSSGAGILNRAGALEVEESIVGPNTATGDGGGIAAQGGSVTVDDTQISQNTAPGGGGISSTVPVTVQGNSLIKGNIAIGGSGGGISTGTSLTVTNSTLQSNDATLGGGIFISGVGSSLTVTNSVILTNTAQGSANGGGGGIAINSGTGATIDNSEISQNTAGLSSGAARPGGGIDANGSNGTILITDTLVDNNRSSGSGAGVAVRSTGALNLARSVVTGNDITTAPADADVRGGGISLTGVGTVTVDDAFFSDNTVTAAGMGDAEAGALQVAGQGTSTITQSTFSDNRVMGGDSRTGAGVLVEGSASTNFTNVTFSTNLAVGASGSVGGGLAVRGSPTVNVNNSTFTGNGAGAAMSGIDESIGSFALKNSIVDDGCASGAPNTDGGGNVVNGTSCGVTPLNDDPELNPLRDNGGNAVGRPGDLRAIPMHDLDPSSPAVDHITGNCTDHVPANVTVDQRGLPRPFNTDCDSGAYELNEVCQGVGVTQAVATPGDETLQGDQGGLVSRRDVINGLGGEDLILALAGDDVLCGDTENDIFAAGAGNDAVDGGAGNDTIGFSTAVNANLEPPGTSTGAGEGTDTPLLNLENINGSPQNDTLTGGPTVNVIFGMGGDDVLAGGGGTGPDGNDTLNGGSNTAVGDTVSYSTRTDQISVVLPSTGGHLGGPEADPISAVENATGGSAGDTLTGDGAINVLTGLGGNDTLTGLGLADTLVLGGGTNTVSAMDSVTDTINCTGGGPNTGTVDTTPAESYVSCSFDGDAVVDFFDACPTEAGTLANGCPAPVVTPQPPATPAPTPKKCKKGFKLKKGKCVKKKRKKR